MNQNRKHKNSGSVAISVKDSYSFKNRDDLSINRKAIESLSTEITHNVSKYTFFNKTFLAIAI